VFWRLRIKKKKNKKNKKKTKKNKAVSPNKHTYTPSARAGTKAYGARDAKPNCRGGGCTLRAGYCLALQY